MPSERRLLSRILFCNFDRIFTMCVHSLARQLKRRETVEANPFGASNDHAEQSGRHNKEPYFKTPSAIDNSLSAETQR